MEAVRFRVTGRVQRVFFRKYTRDQAVELGLKGYVVNEKDESVSGVIVGEAEPVSTMKNWLRYTGSPQSKVEDVDFTVLDPLPTYDQFYIMKYDGDRLVEHHRTFQ